jgi:hypothetical protein
MRTQASKCQIAIRRCSLRFALPVCRTTQARLVTNEFELNVSGSRQDTRITSHKSQQTTDYFHVFWMVQFLGTGRETESTWYVNH